MRLGVWQTEGISGDPAANVARLAVMLTQAKAQGVHLLVTPELWTTGYNAPAAIRAFAEPADGPGFTAIAALARQFGIAIAWGYPERSGDILYNSAQVVGADGARRYHYRKLHLWSDYERGLFVPGQLPAAPFDLDGWRVAMAICYDTEFPELIRRYALAGAELVLAPTALAAGEAVIPDLVVPVRALENGLYIAFCNRCGVEDTLVYQGGSCIVGPAGMKLASAATADALIVATIEKAAIAAARQRAPYLDDRRTDLG
ncbi:MAG: carbon-nitrogen hydrolase family protein [Sandarakinorhabdus sp.]|nr:carbon-nitrogen hydrolase family protein [Sandarakinorhabdus sp.]